jgi:stage II sporulation protein GA (sporulation sigma-E factor processing peptidase)
MKLLIALAMLCVSFHEKPKAYFKLLIMFYIISFTMSGIIYYLNTSYNQRDIITEITILLSGLCITVMMFLTIKFVRERIKNKNNYFNVEIFHNGKKMSLVGFYDTGNNLTEPVSGFPVLILNKKEAKGFGEINTIPIICKTISGKGVINAFCPDKITINNEIVSCYIGLSDIIENESFSILLNNNLRRLNNVS